MACMNDGAYASPDIPAASNEGREMPTLSLPESTNDNGTHRPMGLSSSADMSGGMASPNFSIPATVSPSLSELTPLMHLSGQKKSDEAATANRSPIAHSNLSSTHPTLASLVCDSLANQFTPFSEYDSFFQLITRPTTNQRAKVIYDLLHAWHIGQIEEFLKDLEFDIRVGSDRHSLVLRTRNDGQELSIHDERIL